MVKTKILASNTSTRCRRTTLSRQFTTGSWEIGPLVRQHVAVAFNRDCPFATKKSKVRSMKRCVGRAPKTNDSKKKCECAMKIHARHTGGLDRGNFAQWRVNDMVKKTHRSKCFCYEFSWTHFNLEKSLTKSVSGQPEPVKRRTILCVDHKEIALSYTRCNAEQRPSETEMCSANIPYCSGDDDNNENSNMIWWIDWKSKISTRN